MTEIHEEVPCKPLARFIAENGIQMTATFKGRAQSEDGWPHDAWAYRLRVAGTDRQMRGTFRMGTGHKGKAPTTADVLNCLAMDAASVENASGFADWATDLGFDPDSIKARNCYRQCVRQSTSLRRFLTEPLYQSLLWDTERE